MIEIKIPKEINRYEAKAIGPFTLRQLVCLLICLPLCVGVFLLLKPYIGSDFAGFAALIPGGIAFLFGWYKPYGLKFEKYFKSVFISTYLAPSKRLYKTENYYSGILKEIQKTEEAEKAASGSAKQATKKYKRSKEAIL